MPPCPPLTEPLQLLKRVGLGEYGATVRDAGHPGVNAGWAGRCCTVGLEPELVLGRPCD